MYKTTEQRATSISALWRNFNEKTTAHGFPKVYHNKSYGKKIFWTTIVLLCLTAVAYNAALVLISFMNYEVDVDIQMVHNVELAFPAVTICNISPINKTALNEASGLEDLKKILNDSVDPTSSANHEIYTEDFIVEEEVVEALARLPLQQRKDIGFDIKEMLADCRYAGRQCTTEEFIQFHNPVHGNCYIFNAGWYEGDSVYISRRTGRRHGLQMLIHIHQEEYPMYVGNTAGLQILVHAQRKMPFPEEEGLYIQPGHVTSIGLRQVTHNRAPYPHGNCTDPSKTNLGRNVYEEHYPVEYCTISCTKTCYQKYVMEHCHCSDAKVLMKGTAFENQTKVLCDIKNITQEECKNNFTKLYQSDQLECACPMSCVDTSFVPFISTAIWPSQASKRDILNKFTTNMTTTEYKNNLIKIEVYFEEFNWEHVQEKPSYSFEKLISDLGGAFGLWVGFSVMTVVEFFEFFLDTFLLLFCVKHCGPKVKEDNDLLRKSSNKNPNGESNAKPETDIMRRLSTEFENYSLGRHSVGTSHLYNSNYRPNYYRK